MDNEKEDFLLNVFPEYQGRTLRGDVLNAYYKAEMLLKDRHAIQRRSCGCQYGSMGREVDRLYKEWLERNGKK